MTLFLLDVASWQGGLKPADVVRAGFGAVNLKISHGVTRTHVHPNLTGWIDQARALGLGISTFHYLDASARGDTQARYAHQLITDLGLAEGTAHQVDVESDPPPTLAAVRSYLVTMIGLLGRPVAVYTGDWWWVARDRWDVSDLTGHLWAAPNRGYLTAYPGDTAPEWVAGYGGWTHLSIMQYAVDVLRYSDGTRGAVPVSMSAIRDPNVWTVLTGGTVATSQNGWAVDTTGALQDRAPILGNITVPNGVLRGDVATVLRWVARRWHETVEPLVAGTCWGWYCKPIEGSTTISNHASGTAIDLNASKHPMGPPTSSNMTAGQIAAARAIVKAAGGVVRWGGDYTTRPDPMHWEIVGTKAQTAALAARIRSEEDDMNAAEMTAWARSKDGRDAIAVAVLNHDPGVDKDGKVLPGGIENVADKDGTNPTIATRTALRSVGVVQQLAYQNRDQVGVLAELVKLLVSRTADDDGQFEFLANRLDVLQTQAGNIPQATVDKLGGAGMTDEELTEIIRAAIGDPDRAARIGQHLAQRTA